MATHVPALLPSLNCRKIPPQLFGLYDLYISLCGDCRYGALSDIDAAIQAKVKSLPPDSMLSAEVCLSGSDPRLCLKRAVNLLCLTAMMP